ncbi:hypothetical protein U6A24_18815 [Aquimarina gracilis]|uniref:Alpha/beta hydrolase n=1 Tax=Aquimarina gracilis TaxID=874422 RepID=A0ABU6A0F2_9FLAO|nr:hypothetical protein [Aquimarina gracilis]MEB3347535.1 hypothetical protein [Aquimarina gracilis]
MKQIFIALCLVIVTSCTSITTAQHKKISINGGSGMFSIKGGLGNEEKTIDVFYYKPKTYNQKTRILIVIPGSGRNGDSYRDSWIEEAERYNLLILSPRYQEKQYPYEAYHLGGIVTSLNTEANITFIENTNQVFLDEENLTIDINKDQEKWIFNDFDRLFDLVISSLKSTQKQYDIFGHSAGGQILHRFAIFHPTSKANKIIAANSGNYTLTDFETHFSFGLKNTHVSPKDLRKSFALNLTIFVGELDNENSNGGILLRSKTVDKQGLHRLARAKFFYKTAKAKAQELGYPFNWKLKVIEGVGHSQRKMGDAAGIYLYNNQ